MYFNPYLHLYTPDPVIASLLRRAVSRQGNARAKGTVANQRSTVALYIAFARRARFNPMAPDHFIIWAFIEYLALHVGAPATIKNKLSHVRTFLRMAGSSVETMDHQRVYRAMEAIERDTQYTSRAKDAIPMKILRSVLFLIDNSQVGIAIKTAILLMYFGALRQQEVAPPSVKQYDPKKHPTRGDVRIRGDTIQMTVKWGKTMQRTNLKRIITLQAAPDSRVCPVAMLSQHYAHIPTASYTDPLLMYKDSRHPIPLSVIKGAWVQAIEALGEDTLLYSLHSLRKAAATQAHDAGCGDIQIQRLGGWKSTAYKAYVNTNTHPAVNQKLIQSIS